MKRFHSYISNLPLKSKFRFVVLLSILLVSTASLISTYIVSASYDEALSNSLASNISYSSMEVSNHLNSLNTMADVFLADSSVQDNLANLMDYEHPTHFALAYRRLYDILNEYLFNFKQNHLKYMTLYQNNHAIKAVTRSNQQVPPELEEALIDKAMERAGATTWVPGADGTNDLFLVREIRQIRWTSMDYLGVLVACVDMDSLVTSSTAFSRKYEDASYLIYDGEQTIYRSEHLSDQAVETLKKQAIESYDIMDIDGSDYFIVKGGITDFGWSYTCMVPYHILSETRIFARNICFVIIVSSLLLAWVLSSSLTASITRHFDTLILKMKAFGKDETTPTDVGYDYSHRKDELGLLHLQFDHMVKKIQNLIQVNYVNELLKKEAQLKALENQINPHFLYNTLESVNWRAKAIGEPEISSMVEALGTMLRFTLQKKEGHFTIRQELELVQSYMTIQQIRFEDRLIYQVSADPDLLNARIPRLTIQPLVENAINYALEEMIDQCCIQVVVMRREDLLDIYVKNSGSAFDDNLLEKLRTNQILPHGFGIGLINIQKRLQLTFGEAYGLTLYNEDDFAIARITIPYQS